MSPSPVSVPSPVDPASYSWEATDEQVADRYGLPIDQVVRFDLNTAPAPPRLLAELLAGGRFETSLSEYPPGDYRRLVEAAATRYGVDAREVVPGAGADEILDMCAKAFLAAGDAAVIPVPSYAMYRVVTEQRGGVVIPVPRLGPEAGFALDETAVRAAAARATLVWLCSPNNPTGLPEPSGGIERLLAGIAADAEDAGRRPAAVVVDEAYAEFTDDTVIPLRQRFPNLVVVRTASKAYALAGLRVGFGIAAPATMARLELYRAPGSVGTISETVVTRALLDPEEMRENVERVSLERERLAGALGALPGWQPYPSVTNFILVDLGTVAQAAEAARRLMSQGLVPRTFGSGHPLAHCVRITVRAGHENDRLIDAARRIATETPE
jgi:histidinol-phosphate aminotransferase